MTKKSYTIKLEIDPNDPENIFIPFPEDFLEHSGWAAGDEIEITIEDNQILLVKKK
jgi:hypothetical protein